MTVMIKSYQLLFITGRFMNLITGDSMMKLALRPLKRQVVFGRTNIVRQENLFFGNGLKKVIHSERFCLLEFATSMEEPFLTYRW